MTTQPNKTNNNAHPSTASANAILGLQPSPSRDANRVRSLVRLLHVALSEAGENPHRYAGPALTAFLQDVQNVVDMIQPMDEQ